MRYKRPDRKNALSIVNAAKMDMQFTLSLKPTEESGSTIVRNVYESFRMLGDALLASEGVESEDHITPIKELLKLRVRTGRPVQVVDNLRRLRHNINYYGYKPSLAEIKDAISIAENCFRPLLKAVEEKVRQTAGSQS